MLYGSVGRVGLRALLGSVAYTPLSLFAAGEQGVWLDNSDFTTLFQDAAGTTPVTGYEQFVGLRLDKSKDGVGTNGAKRVNLASWTEDFSNAYWAEAGIAAITAGSVIAPNGTSTAEMLLATAGSGPHAVYSNFPVVVVTNTAYRTSFYAKKNTARYVYVTHSRSAGNFATAVYDLDGVGTSATQTAVGATSGTIASTNIQSVGNGWYRLTIEASATGTSLYVTAGFAEAATGNTFDVSGNVSFTTAGTESIYIWGADLRLASDAAVLPTYQRITDTWYNTIPGNHAYQTTTTARAVLSARKNLLVNTETLATQNVTVRAVQHVLSFWGTGTITLSEVSTAGPLVGTSADNRVYIAFTPTAGTLTLTVSGTVSRAQLEEANEGA